MEFTLICPNDGRVQLGLEDISAVVFGEPESVEVVFVCPHCGTSLRAALRVPNLLVAAMELAQYAEQMPNEGVAEGEAKKLAAPVDVPEADRELRARREQDGEAYCEYFRRQLSRIESVEDLLAELGD